jgi:hypothetical protein
MQLSALVCHGICRSASSSRRAAAQTRHHYTPLRPSHPQLLTPRKTSSGCYWLLSNWQRAGRSSLRPPLKIIMSNTSTCPINNHMQASSSHSDPFSRSSLVCKLRFGVDPIWQVRTDTKKEDSIPMSCVTMSRLQYVNVLRYRFRNRLLYFCVFI